MRSTNQILVSVETLRQQQALALAWVSSYDGARNPEAMLTCVNEALDATNRIQFALTGLGSRLEKQVARRSFQQVMEASGKHRIAAASKLTAGKAVR